MNDVAKQLRTNADFVLGETGLPPDAAIAGALQMGADEIDRLTRELDEARKENERLRTAQQEIACENCGHPWTFVLGPLPAAPNEAGK